MTQTKPGPREAISRMSFPASPGRRAWAALGVAIGLALFLSLGVSPAFSQDDNDDPLPILSVEDASAEEGEDQVFTVTLSPASDQTVKVSYETANASATSGEDCVDVYPGLLLTFEAGDTTGAITVRGLEDDVDELDETFEVWLYDPVGAAFADGSDTVCLTSTTSAGALPHPNRYPTQVVASNKMLPKIGEAAAWEEASARWQNRNCWRRSETATELHPSGSKTGFWTSSSRLPATTGSMASGRWGNPVMTERSSRR